MFLPPLRAGLSPSSCLAGGLGTAPRGSTQGQHPAPWAHQAELCCRESCFVRGSASCSTSGQTPREEAERIKKQKQPKRKKKKETQQREVPVCKQRGAELLAPAAEPGRGHGGGDAAVAPRRVCPAGKGGGREERQPAGQAVPPGGSFGSSILTSLCSPKDSPAHRPLPPSSASPQREGSTNPVLSARGVLVSPVCS